MTNDVKRKEKDYKLEYCGHGHHWIVNGYSLFQVIIVQVW